MTPPPGSPGTPQPHDALATRTGLRAPNWLQVVLIFALLGSAVFVALNGRYLWAILLAVAGLSFGASYLLRHMVGDDYGRA